MGTRSLTFVYDGKEPMLNMYRQFDGYPSGHGSELAEFLNSFDAIVNGIPFGDKRRVANGMGCLAAQLVANFKTGVGGFYIYPVNEKNCGQEYEYHVYEGRVKVLNGDQNTIFDGCWHQFKQFCGSEEMV